MPPCPSTVPATSPRPVVPNQSVSQEVVVEMQNLLANGIPAHRAEKIFLEPMALVSDTYSRIRLEWWRHYARPLVNAIMQTVCKSPILISDETTYDCLQSQGRGIGQAVDNPASQSYVLALSNTDWDKHRFVAYRYIRSRSAQSIGDEVQALGFNPQVLVTDGYGGYRSLLSKRWPNMSHQSCLIHFRREIIEALNLPALGKEIKKLDDQGVAELGRRWLKEQDPSMKMLAVLDGLSTVYHLEELQRDPQESDEQYLERVRLNRRERVKPIMDDIDRIMLSMVSEYTEIKNSKYEKKSGSAWCAPVVYYMNRRDSLRYFLVDERVPCDTNVVERAIRPLTLIRKNSYFTQSIEGLESLCDTFTLFETARVNGIKNPIEWLKAYGQALHDYIFNAAWTQAYQEGKDPSKKIMQWKMEKYREGFDWEPWLPWNWKE